MNREPWYSHVMLWYVRRPLVGYFIAFMIALCWGLLPRSGEVVVLAFLVAPWLFLVLVILNFPFVSALFEGLRLDSAKGRNHALEHGTIKCWYRKYGGKRRVGGRAKTEGFRIYGIHSKKEIQEAFDEFIDLDQEERLNIAVSNRCGSMLVMAQGIGVLLLFITLAAFSIWDFSALTVYVILGAQLGTFLMLRGPLSRLFQRYRFLSVDFSKARILDIKQVNREPLLETGTVYFVRTEVQ